MYRLCIDLSLENILGDEPSYVMLCAAIECELHPPDASLASALCIECMAFLSSLAYCKRVTRMDCIVLF